MKVSKIAAALKALQAATAGRGVFDRAAVLAVCGSIYGTDAYVSSAQGICGNVRAMVRGLDPAAWEAQVEEWRRAGSYDGGVAKPGDQLDDWLKAGFKAWPQFSGSLLYPVRMNEEREEAYLSWAEDNGTINDLVGHRAEFAFDDAASEWEATSYGDARRDLVAFLLRRAELQLIEQGVEAEA